MIEARILYRNIESFRRMLDDETDPSARQVIESMIREFEGMLSTPESGKRSPDEDRTSSDGIQNARASSSRA